MIRGRRRDNPDMWLTPRQAAEKLGCHYNTVWNFIHRDGLKCYRTKGGFIRIKKTDLNDFLRAYYPGVQID